MSFEIVGTGSCLPNYTVENNEFCSFIDTSDEWIVSRTGIRRRHFLKSETLQDIAASAANRALKDAGTAPEELDLILCSTLQGDDIAPSLACLVQRTIGAHCPAFDINAACAGFLYALDIAAAYFAAKKAKKVLIVCAEQLSKFLDWNDRSTCVLFGDGAGAVVLSEGSALLSIRLSARGQREHLNIPGDISGGPFLEKNVKKGNLYMNGQEIYKFAVSTVQKDARFAAEQAGISLDDVDYFLLHQANGRIIDAARVRLKQPEAKFPTNYASCGNTSSASIPILLDELNTENRLKAGDILLMSAFGAGLTSGVCILKWSK